MNKPQRTASSKLLPLRFSSPFCIIAFFFLLFFPSQFSFSCFYVSCLINMFEFPKKGQSLHDFVVNSSSSLLICLYS